MEGQDQQIPPNDGGKTAPAPEQYGNEDGGAHRAAQAPGQKTGGLSAVSLPTTTELPTGTIAAVSPRYALKFPFTS